MASQALSAGSGKETRHDRRVHRLLIPWHFWLLVVAVFVLITASYVLAFPGGGRIKVSLVRGIAIWIYSMVMIGVLAVVKENTESLPTSCFAFWPWAGLERRYLGILFLGRP